MLKYILMCMDEIMEALQQTKSVIQELGGVFLDFSIDVISALLKVVVWIGLLTTAILWILPYYIFTKTRKERRHELQTVEKEL